MFTIIKNFFIPPQLEGGTEKDQDTRTTHRVAVALLGIGFFSIPFIFILESPTKEFALYSTLGGMGLWLITIGLIKREYTKIAKFIILSTNTFNLLAVTFATGGLSRPTIMTTIFLLALATLLFPKRGAINYGLILLALSTLLLFMHSAGLVPKPNIPDSAQSTYFLFSFTTVAVSAILAIASQNARHSLDRVLKGESELRDRNIELNELTEQLEARVEERTHELRGRTEQLEAIANLARSIATIQDAEQLLPTITKQVSEQLGFYHVGIFLLDDEKKFAVLRAANSEGGKKMLKRNHRLGVGQQGIVGFVTARGQARVALDIGEEATYFDNPDLPETRSEVALPLKFGQKIIGALDIQSVDSNAFSQEDVNIFSVLADQISVAIQNAQSLEKAQRALEEADRATQRLTGQAWEAYSQSAEVKGFHFDGSKSKSLKKTGKKPTQGALTIPILVRGHQISNLVLDLPEPDYKWTEDDISIAQAAAERVALALEGARLLEDAQRRAFTEQAISEISAKIGATTKIDDILRSTVQELGIQLGNTEIMLELESDQE